MKKLDDIIEALNDLTTFEESDPFESGMSSKIKREFSQMLIELQFDMKSKTANDTSQIRLDAKDDYIKVLKNRIDYLEDFVVKIARESKDL